MEDQVDYDASQEKGTSSRAPDDNRCEQLGTEDVSKQRSTRKASLGSLWWIILCSSLLLAEVQASLETTMTADLQLTIINTFGEVSKFPWINVTYSLALGSSCLFWGKLLVSFDSKRILLISRLLFAIGSALTAAAPSMDAFILGKAITGFGSSGTYISVIVIIIAMTAPETRGRYFSYIGFMWGLGTIIGPPVGGAFAATAGGWRWSFYFNLILVGVTFPVFLFVLPPNEKSDSHASLWARVRRIDLLGSLLFAGALAMGIAALSFGGALYSFKSGQIIGLFCSSGVLWIAFSIQQVTAFFTSDEDRVLPVHILRSWEMWILIIQTGCSMSVLFITIYYVPLYFQFIRGESAIRAAVDLLPFLFTTVFAMLASGRLIAGFGWYKLWFISGSGLALIMSVCLYTTEIDTSHGKIYAYLILGGIGIGLYVMNSAPVMAAIVTKENTADASTVFGCVDTISGAISVAIANCVFVNRATDSIQRILPDTLRATVQDTITGVGASLVERLPPVDRTAVLQATLDAIKDAWIQLIATATLSLVLSFFMHNKKLSDFSRG
ncbi:MAG: hypothetical protein LQ348_003745 [Seirophora lacunosa]|nr:MAG: hypothetical protein LQ348_003745 [Seirophora lacunosa]